MTICSWIKLGQKLKETKFQIDGRKLFWGLKFEPSEITSEYKDVYFNTIFHIEGAFLNIMNFRLGSFSLDLL